MGGLAWPPLRAHAMIDARDSAHTILHKDAFAYSAHPQVAVAANGDWLVVFNKAPRRPCILHPPQDPLFRNVITRSATAGYLERARGGAELRLARHRMREPHDTAADGRMMLNQWRFRWYPLGSGRPLA